MSLTTLTVKSSCISLSCLDLCQHKTSHMKRTPESYSRVNFSYFCISHIQSINVFCPFSLLDMPHSQSLTGLLSPFLLTPHSIVLFTLALEEFFQNITMIILLSCLMYANAFEKLLENNLNSSMNYKAFQTQCLVAAVSSSPHIPSGSL